MIDFHSHILPGIDDGSKDPAMSRKMLETLWDQGVDTVAATSHFYATQRSVHHFLERREEAYQRLLAEKPERMPQILLGAEVLYFPGISHMEELPELCLEGTDLLLLEMPFTAWTEYMVREVNELARSGRVRLILAHIERYFFDRPRAVWDGFLDNGIYMQSNADFFLKLMTRRRALQLLEEGYIHVLGTDCHNLRSRAPRIEEARQRVEDRMGPEFLEDIDYLGKDLLRKDG